MEAIKEDSTFFWEGDPGPDPKPQSEKSKSAPHPETMLLPERANNRMFVPSAPVPASDIDASWRSTMYATLSVTTQDTNILQSSYMLFVLQML